MTQLEKKKDQKKDRKVEEITTCPECGSDLALVGRISPQFHRWAAVPVTARLIVWTVAVAALGGAFFYVAHESSLLRIQRFRRSRVW